MTIEDVDLLFQLTADKKVMKFLPKILDYNETEQMIRKIIDQYETYGYCFWKLLSRAKDEFVGIAGLLHQEIDGNAETELSYRIKWEYWNNGYATEAARACKEYAENVLESYLKLLNLVIRKLNIILACSTTMALARKRHCQSFLLESWRIVNSAKGKITIQ